MGYNGYPKSDYKLPMMFTSTGLVYDTTPDRPGYWTTTNAIQPPIREREVDTPKVTECKGCGHVGGEAKCVYCGTQRYKSSEETTDYKKYWQDVARGRNFDRPKTKTLLQAMGLDLTSKEGLMVRIGRWFSELGTESGGPR